MRKPRGSPTDLHQHLALAGLIERRIVGGEPRRLQQFRHGSLMPIGILTQVDGRQMKPNTSTARISGRSRSRVSASP